jgi:hypothetical protein
MVNVNHSSLTDPYLHEPKGAATAGAGEVYIANGSGGGVWRNAHNYVNGYIAFDSATPAYQHSVTTSFTPLDPTFSVSVSKEWTGESSPNARLVYSGTYNTVAQVNFTLSYKNSSGSSRNLELIFYKNGSSLNGGHIVVTADSGSWHLATLADVGSFSTDDYLEVFVKGDSAFTLDVASASLTIMGVA